MPDHLTMDPELNLVIRDSKVIYLQHLFRPQNSALVRASQSAFPVLAGDPIVHRVYGLTRGQPFFTQLLADTTWRMAASVKRPSRGQLRFTSSQLSEALTEVVRQNRRFGQFYEPFLGENVDAQERTMASAVLRVFMHKALDPHDRQKLTCDEVSNLLPARLRKQRSRLEAILTRMCAVGTLVPAQRALPLSSELLMIPILAHNLRHHASMTGSV
jgi:hypothetical protein